MEDYFNNHEEINGADLSMLEAEIRKAIRSATDNEQPSPVELEKRRVAEEARRQAEIQVGYFSLCFAWRCLLNDGLKQANEQAIEANTRRPATTGKEWQMIQVYQSIQDEETIRKEQELARQKKMNFRNALDQQRQQSRNQNTQELEDERRYVEHMLNDISRYHAEEQRKREITHKKYQDELVIRKAQIEAQQRRLEEERQELKRIEQRNMEIAQEETQKEAQAIQRARLSEKEKMEIIKKENAENKRLRLIEKEREAEEDFRLMQEYAMKLDRESKQREEAFANRMKEMERNGTKFATEGAGKALREEKLRFEQQLLKEQQRKAEADHLAEVRKSEDRRRKLQEALNENRRQLQERRLSQEEEKKRDALLAEQFRRDMEEFKQQEDLKLQRYREKQAEYRRRLDMQVDEWKKVDKNLSDMTINEKKINRDTLDEVHNPQTMSKVMHRIRMSSARTKTAK